MKVLQFAFGGEGGDNPYLPHHHTPNSVVYTGTHDNNTTAGWWDSLDQKTRKRVQSYLGAVKAGEMPEAFIRAAMTSIAALAVIPMQDVLGLDSEARMNTPSRTNGNWGWRMKLKELEDANAKALHETCMISGRCRK